MTTPKKPTRRSTPYDKVSRKKTQIKKITTMYEEKRPEGALDSLQWAKVWDPATHNQVEITHCSNFLPAAQAAALLEELSTLSQWDRPTKFAYGKQVTIPRDTIGMVPRAFYDAFYEKHKRAPTWRYSQMDVPCIPAIPSVEALFTLLNGDTKVWNSSDQKTKHNFVLLNRYVGGKDSVDWHADDEKTINPLACIDSISLGVTRTFMIRHQQPTCQKRRVLCKKSQDKAISNVYVIPLIHGSFLRMGPGTQKFYWHRVPKEPHVSGTRINLTFRDTMF